MKRFLAFLLATFLLTASLTSCSKPAPSVGSSNSNTPSSQASASQNPESKPSADGTVYTFTVHSHDPEVGVTGDFLKAWAASIEEASGGRIQFNIYHGATLGGPKDALEMVETGTCDIAWGLPSFFSGVFPASEVLMLPMLPIKTTYQSSHVMWDLYNEVPEIAAEFEKYKVLLISANTQSPVASRNIQIKTVEDFAGLNIRGNAGPPTEFIKNLGAAPVSIPIGELYQSIHNGTIDAVITDWNAMTQFQLYETCKYYLDEDIGVSSYFLVMNWDSFNKLPAELQQIMDNCSGDKALEYFYTYWDESAQGSRDIITERGDTIYKFSEEEHAKLQAIADQTIESWIAEKESDGLPGRALYEKVLEIIDRYPEAPEA